MKKKRCSHRKTWIIAGGYYEWCYSCGALRKMKLIEGNAGAPASKWIRPVGNGENPYRLFYVERAF